MEKGRQRDFLIVIGPPGHRVLIYRRLIDDEAGPEAWDEASRRRGLNP